MSRISAEPISAVDTPLPLSEAAGGRWAEFLRADHLTTELRSRSLRGGAITGTSQAAKFIISTGAGMVLGRLLTPGDYGVIGMVTAVIGFIEIFKDLGLSTATIQRHEITHEQVSTLFWVNVVVAAGAALLTAALGPAISLFYHEPRLTLVTLALAVGILFGGLSVQHQALLRRHMRFGMLALVSILAQVASVFVGIVAALLGAGYWSLVLMTLVGGLTTVLCLWVACEWRPGPPVQQSGVGGMLKFGGNLTAFNVVNYLCRNLDNVLVGWWSGATPLGYYSRAYNLLLLPILQINAPIAAVALPALSRLQNAPERFRSFYRKAISLMVTVGMPVVVFTGVDADKIVLIVLGHQWQQAAVLYRALAPAAFVGTFNVAGGWVYLALGRTDRLMRWGIFASAITVTGFFLGLHAGALGVALSYSITSVALVYPSIRYCFHGTWMRQSDLWRSLLFPAFASLAAGAVLYPLAHADLGVPNIFRAAIDLAAYAIVYVGLCAAFPAGRANLREFRRLVQDIKQ